MSSRKSVPPDGISLALVAPTQVATRRRRQGVRTLCAPSERVILAHRHGPRRKADFLAGRIAAKLAIGKALAGRGRRSPAWHRLAVEHGRWGAPRCIDASGVKPWRVSLAHSAGWGLAAVSLDRRRAVGVDIERRRAVSAAMGRHVLAPAERRRLASHGRALRARRFLELWCLKEAVLKALGVGLRVTPASVRLHPRAGRIRVHLAGAARTRWPHLTPGRFDARVYHHLDFTIAVVAIDGPTRPRGAGNTP